MKVNKRIAAAVLIGFAGGVFWLVALRFITYQPAETHYHANFALYINGRRDEFRNFTFYEEVQSCGTNDAGNPKHRAHMHDQVNHVVHVHEPGVMWGHFFANLGYMLGDTLVKTDGGTYLNEQNGNQLTFVLNGKATNTISNRLIKSQDVLLVSYGQDDAETIQQRYDAIIKDAADYNRRKDPSSCSGPSTLTLPERLKKAIGIF